MPISITEFGGIIPVKNCEKLPDNAAQYAHNCNLTGGILRPLSIAEPFVSMHDEDGLLNAGFDSDDAFQITKPEAPSSIELVKLCKPESWLTVKARLYLTWRDSSGNNNSTYASFGTKGTLESIKYTETGLRLEYSFDSASFYLSYNTAYVLTGPKFQFILAADDDNGGPDEEYKLPVKLHASSAIIPGGIAPLTFGGNPGIVYGQFQVDDSDAPNFDDELYIEGSSTGKMHYSQALDNVSFDINLNYTSASRRTFYYVQTMVKDRENEIEGPPSEISSKITVLPGERVKLNVPRADGYTKNNLYRSFTGGDDFRMLKEVDDDEYIDYEDQPAGIALPAYGNYPDCNVEDFLEGSIIHPAQFGCAYLGSDLYFSDYYKLHVWPEEYSIPFKDDIKAIALSGGTIIVFAGDKVYGVSGGNPAAMSKYLISATMPLLNKCSLCRSSGMVFYVSYDGLICVGGGTASNLTKHHFSRTEWLELDPENMEAKTADNSIFLETSSGTHFKFDIEESLIAACTYSDTSDVSLTWKTKRFHFTDKEVFDYARIEAEGDVALNVYADRTLAGTYTISDRTPEVLGLSHANDWEFEVEADCEIRSLEFHERNVLPMGDYIRLTPENIGIWQSIWLKFPDCGSFSGGIISAQTEKNIPVTFYRNGNEFVHTEYVFNGRMFKLPFDMSEGELWRIEVDSLEHIDSLILFARRRQLFRNSIREFRTDPSVAPWMLKIYESSTPVSFSSGRVVSEKYPVELEFYANGIKVKTRTVNDSRPFRIGKLRPERKWSFNIIENSGVVISEFSIATGMEGIR